MSQTTDVLIYVEDPGAANYVAGIPSAMAERGWRVILLAQGAARDYLAAQKVRVDAPCVKANPENILSSIQPRLVVVGTSEDPDSLGLVMVEAARAAGATSVGIVDARANAEYCCGSRRLAGPRV